MSFISWSPGISLDSLERSVILYAFRFYGKNKTATASSLGISIRTLENKIEKYNDEDEEHANLSRAYEAERHNQLLRARGLPIERGLGVESYSDVTAQLELPVPQRQEVQEVLSAKATSRRTK